MNISVNSPSPETCAQHPDSVCPLSRNGRTNEGKTVLTLTINSALYAVESDHVPWIFRFGVPAGTADIT